MAGPRLSWEIESEQVESSQGEDPALALGRRLRLMRLLLGVLLLVALFVAAAVLVIHRVREAGLRMEDRLRSTVEAEVASLRLADREAFMNFQRSATDDWLNQQSAMFDLYQALKLQTRLQLSGKVLQVEISGQRGRVHVEEIINDVSYTRIWFYWLYEDGWRHVPPDYTFWGSEAVYTGSSVVVRYRTVDERFATSFGQQFEGWLQAACAALDCGQLPVITVDVVTNMTPEMQWLESEAWHLLVVSPYGQLARTDQPFDTEMQTQAATLLAERLVAHVSGGLAPVYPADAYYLRSAVISWLVGRFMQAESNAYLISSLSRNYGEAAVGQLVRQMQPDSSISILADVTGVPVLSQANLDWRDFVTWRLLTERELINRRDEFNWLLLYDTRDEAVRLAAYGRYNAYVGPETITTLLVQPQTAFDGTPQLLATVRFVGAGNEVREETVLFNLVNNIWLRGG